MKKKCYNVTVPVTMFKYLPFSAGKTAHLDKTMSGKFPQRE